MGAVGQMLDLGAVRLPLDGEALFGSPVPLEATVSTGNPFLIMVFIFWTLTFLLKK